ILKLRVNPLRRPRRRAEAFYSEAMALINRAMAGVVSVREIEVWLYLTQYVVGSTADRAQQVLGDAQLEAMLQARTARMNYQRLRVYLEAEQS
ncbi:MAG: hypothetical protein Q9191_008560, partial [Dirinaria sp. TL-2023a]